MKRRIFTALTVFFLMVIALTAVFPVTAAEEESARELDATTAAQLDYTDTYFYDRISERQQWCYNWLKDYYDTFTGEPGRYQFDFAHLLPEGFTEEEADRLGDDFLIGGMALLADNPLYEIKGEVSGFGVDVISQSFVLEITHMDIRTADADVQVAARIEQIVETIGEGDRYTKLYKLSHYFLSNTFYDPYFDTINPSGHRDYALATKGYYYDHVAYGLFIKNIAVCDGFADSVKVLCDELDIPCIIIGNNMHAWNMVQMEDGSWYFLDLTRDKLGWDGYTDIDDFFANIFLKSNAWDLRHSPPYYTIALNNVYYADVFPEESSQHYVYTGSTTDFSYTEAPSTYVPGEPTFSYKVNPDGKTCTITNFEGRQEGDLIIPESIDGYTVTAIEAYSFYYCTGFTGKLVIPDTVKTIGKAAFAGCYNLTSVKLPGGLREIGYGAFIGCKGLTDLTLPDLVDEIANYAFYDCDKLTSVAFGGHIQSVGANAFAEIAASVILKAPAGSAVEKYAAENGIAFEAHGTLCSFVDADGDWEFDNNGHFHTCEHGGRFDRRDHTNEQGYFNCGDRCDVCNAQKCNKFGFMEGVEVFVDARPATCVDEGYTGDVACICQNVFFRPGETIEPTGEHTSVDGKWKFTSNGHYQTCKDCGQMFNSEIHRGGTATETERAKCEVCGAEYGELIPHDHRGGAATETERAKCEVCGAEYGELIPHDHRGGTATETKRAKCEVCGIEYGELLPGVSAGNGTGTNENDPGKSTDSPDLTWVWIAVAAICVLALGAVVIVVFLRKKKQ